MSDDAIKIKIIFNGNEKQIKSDKYTRIGSVLNNYAKEIDMDINNLYFIYNGDLINLEKSFDDICEKSKEINILVYEYENENDNEELKISNDIICPICKEICMINFKDYKITLNNCKNGHNISKILFEELNDFQKINESKITCKKCSNNKNETMDNKFFICLDCNINLCPLCKLNHIKNEKKHLIIDYDIKNNVCNEHVERYILHCEKCNKDFCDNCNHHNVHKVSFLFKYIKKVKIKRDDLRIKIDKLKNELLTNIENTALNKIIQNLELYFNICDNIVKNFDKKGKNYYSLMNTQNINDFNEMIFEDIEKILNEKNIDNKNNLISNLYNKMIINSEFILKYNIKKNGKLKILGEPFVKKNKNNFILIINQKTYELSTYFDTSIINDKEDLKMDNRENKDKKLSSPISNNNNEKLKNEINQLHSDSNKEEESFDLTKKQKGNEKKIKNKNNEEFEIRLKQIKNVSDISYMFAGSTSLKKVQDLGGIMTIYLIWQEFLMTANL